MTILGVPRRFRSTVAGTLAAVMLMSFAAPALAEPPAYKADAKSALLIDYTSGDVLYGQSPDQVYAPASITKLMTLRLAFKALHEGRIKPTDSVTISKNAWAQNPAFKDASLMFLEPNKPATVEQILKGIAIPSGNDASVAIAELLAGTVNAFVQQMNDEAKRLGMNHTHFVDPDGLSPDNQTTANDLAILAKVYITEEPEALQQLHSVPDFTYNGITQKNNNWLIGTYQGIDGLKTGFLDQVGYNQISTAKRGDMRLIGILIGTKSLADRRDQSAALLDYGFNNYTSVAAVKGDAVQGTIRVWLGQANQVTVVPAADINVTLPKGSEAKLQHTVTLSESMDAPIVKGQKLGTMTFTVDGKTVRTVDLVAQSDVARAGFFKRTWDHVKLFFMGLFHKKK